MATSLRHNLTSTYLDAARKLSPKRARRRIVAYVESYDDIAFWRTLLSEFENEERYFQVMLPSATSLAKGKKMVLIGMIRELNPNVQLILTTHSPAVIMEGWLDAVTEVEEISTEIER